MGGQTHSSPPLPHSSRVHRLARGAGFNCNPIPWLYVTCAPRACAPTCATLNELNILFGKWRCFICSHIRLHVQHVQNGNTCFHPILTYRATWCSCFVLHLITVYTCCISREADWVTWVTEVNLAYSHTVTASVKPKCVSVQAMHLKLII